MVQWSLQPRTRSKPGPRPLFGAVFRAVSVQHPEHEQLDMEQHFEDARLCAQQDDVD